MDLLGNQSLLAPVEDALAEREVENQEEFGEDVADLKHTTGPQTLTSEVMEKHLMDHPPY